MNENKVQQAVNRAREQAAQASHNELHELATNAWNALEQKSYRMQLGILSTAAVSAQERLYALNAQFDEIVSLIRPLVPDPEARPDLSEAFAKLDEVNAVLSIFLDVTTDGLSNMSDQDEPTEEEKASILYWAALAEQVELQHARQSRVQTDDLVEKLKASLAQMPVGVTN